MLRFECMVWGPAERDNQREWEKLDHPQAPTADQFDQESAEKYTAEIGEGGGGGGNPGATMISRLQDAIPEMGPEEAADTGGRAIAPWDIVPLTSAGEVTWAGSEGASAHQPYREGQEVDKKVVRPSSKDQSGPGELRAEAMQESVNRDDMLGPEHTVSPENSGYQP